MQQTILNAAAHLYAGVSKHSHVSAILRDDFHWLSIPQRIKFKLCTRINTPMVHVPTAYPARQAGMLSHPTLRTWICLTIPLRHSWKLIYLIQVQTDFDVLLILD